ncbi:MAG: HDIG domain-containing protein [Clostridia bacterium]|nr:HDIG domain-containing protein [Clostridia bacterium]
MDAGRVGKRAWRQAAGLLLLLLVCLENWLLLCLRYPDTRLNLQAGDVLSADLLYPYSGIDPYRTDWQRQVARDKTEPVYALDTKAVLDAEEGLSGWFDRYDLFLQEMVILWGQGAQEHDGKRYNRTAWDSIILPPALAAKIEEYGLGEALDATMAYALLNGYLPQNSLHDAGETPDTGSLRAAITEAVLAPMQEGIRETDLSAAREQVKTALKQSALSAVEKTELAGNLIDLYLQPSLVVDQVQTEQKRSAAAAAVNPVSVRKGALLLPAGTTLSGEDISHLAALNMLEDGTASHRGLGFALYLIPIYCAFALYLLLAERETAFAPLVMVRLSLALMLTLALVWAFTLFESRIAPLLMGTLMIAATHEKKTARSANVLLSLTGGLFLPQGGLFGGETFAYAAAFLAAGQVAISLMSVDTRRTGSVLAAAVAGGLGGLMVAAQVLLAGGGWLPAFLAFGLVFLGALLALVLSMGFTAIWELLFGLPSESKLNELLSANHPLQRRLMNSAPGTYHHCQMVALLSESGARAIGANALLSKAAASLHDVGKLKDPLLFSENQANGINPHDQLPPQRSARIIIGHVAEGEELLSKYKVPLAVRRIVAQHHGTTLVAYFYHKARQEGEAKEADFRYPGPRPDSRESAILMLADSCEAAVRSLKNPSPAQVKDMVAKVFQGKLEDGQLAACPLTLSEMSRVQEAFLKTLTGILHDRISYPKEEP